MRPIKFRALIISNTVSGYKKWIYYTTLEKPSDLMPESRSTVVVKDLQYTGHKGFNGQELYEDDIVKMPYTHDFGEIEKIGAIEYDPADAVYRIDFPNDGMSIPLWRFNENRIEKIGNIHENQELLKGGSDGRRD